MRFVLVLVPAVLLWTENTTSAVLSAILTLYAGLLASQILPENFPNQNAMPGLPRENCVRQLSR
jgi:hypothetical protein